MEALSVGGVLTKTKKLLEGKTYLKRGGLKILPIARAIVGDCEGWNINSRAKWKN